MAELTIVYWRDIPAQVVAKAGRRAARQQLSERFEKAIDRAAMKAKLRDDLGRDVAPVDDGEFSHGLLSSFGPALQGS